MDAQLKTKAVLETLSFPEKAYAARIHCEDGSYVDIAAVGRTKKAQIIVVYYRTPAEYINSFSLSVEALLTGYKLDRDGTIIVSNGGEIVASNDEELIGKGTDEIGILKRINQEAECGKLVHTNRDAGSISQYFGLMEHGRDFYFYAYMPEKDVFSTTFQNVLYSLIVYILILVAINMVRWRTAQGYKEQQLVIQREYTESLQQKNEQLRAAVTQAEYANAAKTNFLSRMSHDIRTPLNGIIGLLEINELHADDLGLIRENCRKMKVSANHLLSLINDVLQMSKLESGEIVLNVEPINLSELSKSVLTIVGQRAADAGITWEYDGNGDDVCYADVYGSPLHIRQIFLNIYGNCIKYNKVGGKITTSCTCLGVADGIVTYQWKIRDTGIGMSEEFVKHIFEPFSQEHTDARSVYNGTGLGMSIVKNLIDKMHGEIEVTSEEGVGSLFVVTLPFRIAKETSEHRQDVGEVQTTSMEGMELLLVEDNELNAEIAQTLLEDKGFKITRACDGRQAIDLFCANAPGTFDAILMDVMIPVIDGITATKMIRELDREDARSIPIIAMTANAFDEDANRCLAAGMNAHLAKPLQMDKLMETLRRYCGQAKMHDTKEA
ncbi:MAG: response regulator [Agathobacter sp.]|nr:response regulator [Agathobacter sp.]